MILLLLLLLYDLQSRKEALDTKVLLQQNERLRPATVAGCGFGVSLRVLIP